MCPADFGEVTVPESHTLGVRPNCLSPSTELIASQRLCRKSAKQGQVLATSSCDDLELVTSPFWASGS